MKVLPFPSLLPRLPGLPGPRLPTALLGATVLELVVLTGHPVAYPFCLTQERRVPVPPPKTPPGAASPGTVPGSLPGSPSADRPVVLLHGFIDNRSVFVLLRRALARHGRRHLASLNHSPLTRDLRTAAELLGRHVEVVCACTGQREVDIVGHSLGGLIARYYVQRLGGDRRVRTLVTLGTPHGGTTVAPGAGVHPIVRQMRGRSALIEELRRPAPGCRTRFVSFWSELDQVMVPVETACVDHPDLDAVNVRVTGIGHLALPVHPAVAAAVREALESPEAREATGSSNGTALSLEIEQSSNIGPRLCLPSTERRPIARFLRAQNLPKIVVVTYCRVQSRPLLPPGTPLTGIQNSPAAEAREKLVNDQHPHAGPVGYDTRSTGSFDTDPLFGTLPGGSDTTDYAASGYDGSYGDPSGHTSHDGHSGPYGSSAWDTGTQQTVTYDAYAAQPQADAAQQPWDTGATAAWQQTSDQDLTGQWSTADTGAFPTAGFTTAPYGTVPYGTGAYGTDAYDTGSYGSGGYGTGTYDTGAYGTVDADGTGTYATTAFTTGVYDTGAYDTGTYDTGAYDATAWNSGATPGDAAYEPEQTSHQLYEQQTAEEAGAETAEQTGADRAAQEPTAASSTAEFAVVEADAAPSAEDGDTSEVPPLTLDRTVVRTPAPRNRARRRSPAKRSALLTVAVPSACVMSVAGIAAASVSGISGEEKQEETTSLAVADPSTVKPVAANNKLDSQLEQLSEGSDDFRQRASRTQERIDLKQRQAAEKKKREEEAARREALRPKFVLPVKQHGLSAYYGQAGVNWMSVHTGIDFPVGYGAPVMAATDGTVRTQYNSAYGNMAIVTMADGTETWYCHLSSTKIRSGPVKAGDVIAYAGSSGNSTGPHLHFEVRPGGGASVDPLAWLRSHGVDPT